MPLKALKNSARSASRSKPTIRLKTPSATEAPRPATLRREPGRLHEDAQRAAFDELGEAPRRVEEVERVAGRRRVEDEQVEAALAVQLEELLHRHVLLRAGQGAGDLLVDAVVRGPGRGVSSSGAWRATSSSKVALASSIIAHSSPSISIPCASNSFGSTRLASLPSSFRPSESARRLAGSIVSTQTFSPRAAIPVAIAAEVVVLPTPPEPAQMQMPLPSRMSPTAGISPASWQSCACRLDARARARRGRAGS